ncbi:hypothetical protein AMTRI_Chr02g214360 [Amborella trichopoda]
MGTLNSSSLLFSHLITSVWSSNWRQIVTPRSLSLTKVTAQFLTHSYRPAPCSWSFTKRLVGSTSITQANTTISTSPSNVYPGYTSLLPCPSKNGPPRIEHLIVSEGGPVLDYICKALDLPTLFVADLIHFGAVYYALVSPEPPPSATPEQVKLFKEATARSVLRKRASLKGKTVREAQKTFRITHANEFVEEGTYLRVYVHPKRFPRCYEIDWRSRVIAETESYVVLDKPAATTVGGTPCNIEECCATFVSRALGLDFPLRTTHQIDNCTEGCVVFSKTKEFCSIFHGKIREKQVKKLYLALATAPVPVGVISHYMRPVNRAPRIISKDHIGGWHLCQLEVLECKEVPWPRAAVEAQNGVEECGWPSKDFAYECKINLLTGRTHQIRAQLAACGAPIVGDTMYLPASIKEIAFPNINPFCEANSESMCDESKGEAVEEWIAQHGKEPNAAIGLQACEISWDGGACFYTARAPWWRSL